MEKAFPKQYSLHFLLWLLASLSAFWMYMTAQYLQRAAANEPQIQMAREMAGQLQIGKPVGSLVFPSPVDMRESLAPFVEVYNQKGEPVAGSGKLDGALPSFPVGALEHAAASGGRSELTWQPLPGFRFAAAIHAYSSGYVVAARSLAESERLQSRLLASTAVFWLIASIFIFTHAAWVGSKSK